MPSSADREVFSILKNDLLTRLEIIIHVVDIICHVSHKVLQDLQVIRVSVEMILCVSVSRDLKCQVSKSLRK